MARVLIVDDAQMMRNILRVILENAGHEIVGNAENGQEALDKYGELNPDLVTMDIHMEGGDGMTFLKRIKKQYPDARVIMVSGVEQGNIKEKALDWGASGYVTKPFQVDKIIREIRKVLAT